MDPGLITMGLGLAQGYMANKKKKKGDFETIQPREYEEANKARGMWLQNLQKWGGEESFGAIAPNWDEIWEQARQKVSGYWKGTPTSPGVMDKLKSESARRRTTEGPAMQKMMLAAGAEEAQQLKGISVEQALAKSQFGETGRQNWLQSIQALSGERAPQPMAQYVPGQEQGGDMGGALSKFGGALSDYFGAKKYQEFLKDWTKKQESGAGAGAGNTGFGPGIGLESWDKSRGIGGFGGKK